VRIPNRFSNAPRSKTPPSLVSPPASNAAVTYLPASAGTETGRGVGSMLAGVAVMMTWQGFFSTTDFYHKSMTWAISAIQKFTLS
jgi:hypothetical protein